MSLSVDGKCMYLTIRLYCMLGKPCVIRRCINPLNPITICFWLSSIVILVCSSSISDVTDICRLNCQKSAMHSLRLARNHSSSEHERLVYEGWILYDTGHREEALAKAEESISLQRSFEAFFLKAYALADSSLDSESSTYVIQLLEEALRCPSDGLRKGQVSCE